MGRKGKPDAQPGSFSTPAIDHLFDGDADPARPRGDHPTDIEVDVDVDLPSLEDGPT
jgi:hypothetical protein